MEVTVYGPLRSATGKREVVLEPEERTVRAVLEALVTAYPRAESQLTDDGGEFRPSVRVVVDGERADIDEMYPPDADIAVFPAMRGG